MAHAAGGDKTVDRHDVEASLHWLAAVESQAHAFLGSDRVDTKAALVGQWYLRSDVLKHIAQARFCGGRDASDCEAFVARIAGFRGWRLLKGLMQMRHTTRPLQADAVVLKNHIRAFYFEKGITLKCNNPIIGASAAALGNEIGIRAKIKNTSLIRIPPIVHAESSGDCKFIIEHALVHTRKLDAARDLERLATGLFNFYLRNGMAQKRLGDAVQLPVILDAVKKSFSLSGLDTSQLCSFADRIEDLSSSGAPYGLCHGDLSVGNLLVDDNTIFIVDWERARFDMVFADLVKLFRQIPGLKARLAARFDEWNGAQTLSPLGMMDQMALGSMIHMANMWDRYSGVLGTREESILASLRKEKVQYYAKRLAADLSRLVAV